jgi:hypothetical protein
MEQRQTQEPKCCRDGIEDQYCVPMRKTPFQQFVMNMIIITQKERLVIHESSDNRDAYI